MYRKSGIKQTYNKLNHERKKRMGLMYHYCNVDTFLNIIRKKALWMSDINKSNDPREGKGIFQDIIDCISNMISSNTDSDYNTLYKIIDYVMNYDCEMRLYNDFNAYAICFSKNGDLLSQWRGYTQNAAGISIGFDEKILNKWSYSYGSKKIAEYRKVQYGVKEYIIKENVEKLIELVDEDVFIGEPSDQKRLLHPFYQYLSSLANEGYFIKDKGFSEEKEKRLIYREYYQSEDAHNVSFMDYSSSTEINKHMKEFSLNDVKYRVWSSGFKKYYELSFDNVKDKIVKEIIIGPKCELQEKDVEELLSREGYTLAGLNKIKIRRSNIIMQ